jgi:hypothetical protein
MKAVENLRLSNFRKYFFSLVFVDTKIDNGKVTYET